MAVVASAKALGSTELLLQVLDCMDTGSLINAQRVCRCWYSIIATEENLQIKLFLKPKCPRGRIELIEKKKPRMEDPYYVFQHSTTRAEPEVSIEDQVLDRFWAETGGGAILRVSVTANPLLEKVFRSVANWNVSRLTTIIDLRSTADQGIDVEVHGLESYTGFDFGKFSEFIRYRPWGGAGRQGHYCGMRLNTVVHGIGSGEYDDSGSGEYYDSGSGDDDDSSSGGDDDSSDRGGCSRAKKAVYVPGLIKMLDDTKAMKGFLCDGGSWENMYLTSPPIHCMVLSMMYLDGPMAGWNFVIYDNRSGEPLTIGQIVRDLQRRSQKYKVAWIKLHGAGMWN